MCRFGANRIAKNKRYSGMLQGTLVKRAIVTGLAALSVVAGGNLLAPAQADATQYTYHELWRVEFRQRSGQGNAYRARCASDAAARGYDRNYVSVGTSVDDPLHNVMVCYGLRLYQQQHIAPQTRPLNYDIIRAFGQ